MKKIELVEKKIFTKESIAHNLALWRFKNEKIVFTNGCFDILHQGHIHLISNAAEWGTKLIVGINSDDSVKRLKGVNRPIQDERTRALVLASLHFVDAVMLFNEDTPYELIKYVEPDVLVKGGDYKADEVIGADIVRQKGGRVEIVNLLEGFSTTGIENRMKSMG